MSSRDILETAAISVGVVATVHPYLDHVIAIGWTALAGLATAIAVWLLKAVVRRWGPTWLKPAEPND